MTMSISNKFTPILRSFTTSGISLCVLSLCLTIAVHGIQVGPKAKPQPPAAVEVEESNTKFLKSRMNIPPLRLAIPILDPGIPESTAEQEEKGIWPELRKTEAVRCAFMLKEWIHRFNQFDEIVVSADTSVSADVYLLARIEQSDGETMKIRYDVVDARNRFWLRDRVNSYRVEPGWHERYGTTDRDPFDPLYLEIAEEVYEALKIRGKAHVDQLERNRKMDKNRAQLSELQRIYETRRVVFASYIAPDTFGDAFREEDNYYELNYLPSKESTEWSRIESIMHRDDEFVGVIESYYAGFVDKMEQDYSTWQQDSFPVARQVRISKRNRNLKSFFGAALLIASAAALKDGAADAGDGSAELGVSVGTAAGGALLLGAFRDNQLRKQAVEEISELARSLHNAARPTRVDLDGKVVTLTGTVEEQYQEWSSMLLDLYHTVEHDPDAVRILTQ